MSVADLAARLPAIPELWKWTQSLAVLDAILCPEHDMRYFTFDPAWSETQALAAMDNGSGDEWSIVFGAAGVYVRGFDHESDLSPWGLEPPAVLPGLIDDVPEALRELVTEPAFTLDDVPSVTHVLWRLAGDASWSYGLPSDPALHDDSSADDLFAELAGEPAAYVAYASEYFEVDLPASAVERVLAHEPLTDELIRAVDGTADVRAARDEAKEIGYGS